MTHYKQCVPHLRLSESKGKYLFCHSLCLVCVLWHKIFISVQVDRSVSPTSPPERGMQALVVRLHRFVALSR